MEQGKEVAVRESAETLIGKAIEKNVSVETMERLLAMRTQLKQEQARELFFTDLAAFQSEIGTIKKTKQVLNKDKTSVRYSYAPLDSIVEQVKDALKKNGFSYTLKTEQEADKVSVICEAHHSAGHTEKTAVKVSADKDAYMNDIQKTGAAISYAKRYAFMNAFGIMTGDEDVDAIDAVETKPVETKPAAEKLKDAEKTEAKPAQKTETKPEAKAETKPAAKPVEAQSGDYVITGKTYDHRPAIKAAGGYWDKTKKAWIMSDADAHKIEALLNNPDNGLVVERVEPEHPF